MKYLQNLHTHSTYCDGKNSLEEMVIEAINKGFNSLGFSSHSHMHFPSGLSMSEEKALEYKKEIKLLKEKYQDKIDIFCGLEVESQSEVNLSGYDYLIGSAHYFKIDDKYVGFDRSAEEVKSVIDNYFDGKGILYAKEYYNLLIDLPQKGNFDIIGHFDLITKHSDNVSFFDENSKEYLSYAFDAARSLVGKIPFFEVNTGAISRGYRKTPYPSIPILKELNRLGFGVIISSDCHDKNMLDCYFSESVELVKSCGFTEHYVLTKNGFKGLKF